MAKPDSTEEQETVLLHLRSLGLEARLMKGGRCVLASMDLESAPFETIAGSRRIRKVLFATVGNDRIKCLRPRCLFQLPPILIRDCRHTRSIEARIRHAWTHHLKELRAAHRWLGGIGAEATPIEEGSVLSVPIEGERDAEALFIDSRRAILPSHGPLEGLTLASPRERVLDIAPGIDSALDLSIHLTNRISQLVRTNDVREHRRRQVGLMQGATGTGHFNTADKRSHTLLLVGPHLIGQKKAIESLRLRGYRVVTAKGEKEAIDSFDAASPELVMADVNLGRSEGLDLMLSLRETYGVENIPMILMDSTYRAAKREAARSLGAAGYLIYPLNVPKIAQRLLTLVEEPNRRRFTRYPNRLALRIPGTENSGLLTALSRGGMFVATDRELPLHSLHDFELRFPEVGRNLHVKAEVIYQTGGPGRVLSGVGVRFHRFPETDERVLLEYIRTLEG